MAKDYVEYLSANVLNDGQTVNYRTLSRALKIHGNLAKQMLYDFHHSQNKNKPNTLHATYLITGRQTILPQQQQENGPDTAMRSSPAPSSPPHQQHEAQQYLATSILLVDQDHLDSAKSTFDHVLSVHVYSVQPGKLNDLQILSECNRAIASKSTTEDLLETSKQYGIIQNSQVKRRPLRRPQQQPSSKPAPSTAVKSTKSVFASSKPAEKDASKDTASAKSTPASSQASAQSSTKPASTKPVPLKRDSSSLFKAFAKAKPKIQSQQTESSAEHSPVPESAPKEDEPMHGLSDEEDDNEDTTMFDEGALTEAGGKTKKEREEELRRMMDMEDEPMADAPPKPAEAENPEDVDDEVVESKPEPETKDEPEETVTVTNGRRRGRRRVMKKKTVQDEEGYLVTREEPGWESFSEEEPVPKKAKVSTAPSAAKPKKAAPKGQGSIMSFFSKK